MINKKKELSEEEKKEILETLDVIDISIYDLLVKRKELKTELENVNKFSFSDKMEDLSSSIHKISEQRKCDSEILSFTAGILNTSNLLKENIEIGIQSKKDSQNVFLRIQNINKFFPFAKSVKYKSYSKNLGIIDAISTYPNMLASISASKTTPKDVWWIPLLANDNKNIKIMTKLLNI